jgi:hypothetical protein
MDIAKDKDTSIKADAEGNEKVKVYSMAQHKMDK